MDAAAIDPVAISDPSDIVLHTDKSQLNVIQLLRVSLDCSNLFREVKCDDGNKMYLLQHAKKTNVLDLESLDPLRKTTKGNHEFLPKKIYVRQCMQEIFNKIVQANDDRKYTVVFGSPGVGKSVLSFLASLCIAHFIKKPVLFLRKTAKRKEFISVFLITSTDDRVTVEFDRNILKHNKLLNVHDAMVKHVFAKDTKANILAKFRNPSPYLRRICDGPRHGHEDHVADSDLVTSGGYNPPKDEASDEITSLPLSAWTQKEVLTACRYLYNAKAPQTKEIFFVCGGNIRKISSVLEQTMMLQNQRDYIDNVVKNSSNKQNLQLAYESTSMSATEQSIDRLRAMFAKQRQSGTYITTQYIGSPYLLRLIWSEISMDETRKGLQYAKQSGIRCLYGWHFELFGHKVFQVLHKHQLATAYEDANHSAQNCHRFQISESHGTGKESVKQLDRPNLYWTPSMSNFANIDAAIGLNGTLYCIQYTVSSQHTFNLHTFGDFLDELPSKFRKDHPKTVVIFVVPEGESFQRVVIPKSQKVASKYISCKQDIALSFPQAQLWEDSDDKHMDNAEDSKLMAGQGNADDYRMETEENLNMDRTNDTNMDEGFSDEDCGEEELCDVNEADSARQKELSPYVHFHWEMLCEDFSVEKPPLSFLNKLINIEILFYNEGLS